MTQPHERLYFLDWLRIAAFGLLVPYHVGMVYVSWDFHLKSPFASTALEPWMRLSSPWRLSLLFLVSGAAVSLMLRGHDAGFLRSRSKRLLLPLLLGMAVIVPPQSYAEVVQKYGYAGSYLEFLGLYLTGDNKGFCKGSSCLILPTWNHLWFVAYLWVYCVALWALMRVKADALEALARGIDRWLGGVRLLMLPVALLALLRLAMAKRFPVTHALVDDWFAHAQYLAFFLLGAAWARQPQVWERLAAARWAALGLCALAWGALWALFDGYGATPSMAPGGVRIVWMLAFATMQWCGVVAAAGFARRWLNREHRWRATLNEAVFPVYIVHQTATVLLVVVLRPLHWAAGVEGPLLVAATFAISTAVYLFVRRVGLLRPWFGLAPARARPSRTRHAQPPRRAA